MGAQHTNPGFQPFGFAGGLYDADTRLVRFGEREYDPDTGAFVTKDPTGFTGGANVYAYAAGDPENFVDPTGADSMLSGGVKGAGAGGLLGYTDAAGAQALDPNMSGYDCGAIWKSTAEGALGGAIGGAIGARLGRGRNAGGGARPQQRGGCSGLCPRGNCFVAGTPVQTAEGERPIESLRAGDQVWARDPETGEVALHPVVRTYAREANDVLAVDIAEESAGASRIELVRVTAEHPWWTSDRGWIETRNLREGEPLGTRDGGKAWVFGVASSDGGGHGEPVFNLEVEGAHTYFVGRGAAWVHNNCGTGGGPKVTPEGIRQAMEGAPLATKQGAVSIPVIQNYVDRAAAGEVAPAIKVVDGVIVEGNHRYIAGRIAGIEPAQTEGIMPAFKAAKPNVSWADVFLDPSDWGNR